MKLLALDTAAELMAVAVVNDEAAQPQRALTLDAPGGPATSARLIPESLALLDRAGLTLGALDAMACGIGPGAFTGLRTAVSVAQGFAYGARCPVLLIDSLMIVAEDARLQGACGGAGTVLWVAMDARMDEVYAAAYQWQAQGDTGCWQVLAAPALYDPATLCVRWQQLPPVDVAGTALAAFGERLPVPAAATAWPVQASRAAALLNLARSAWQAGAGVPPEQALPVYVRDKVALTTAEREALRGPAAA